MTDYLVDSKVDRECADKIPAYRQSAVMWEPVSEAWILIESDVRVSLRPGFVTGGLTKMAHVRLA
jgi:hypothetical protein